MIYASPFGNIASWYKCTLKHCFVCQLFQYKEAKLILRDGVRCECKCFNTSLVTIYLKPLKLHVWQLAVRPNLMWVYRLFPYVKSYLNHGPAHGCLNWRHFFNNNMNDDQMEHWSIYIILEQIKLKSIYLVTYIQYNHKFIKRHIYIQSMGHFSRNKINQMLSLTILRGKNGRL